MPTAWLPCPGKTNARVNGRSPIVGFVGRIGRASGRGKPVVPPGQSIIDDCATPCFD